jgi:hypothetical protein
MNAHWLLSYSWLSIANLCLNYYFTQHVFTHFWLSLKKYTQPKSHFKKPLLAEFKKIYSAKTNYFVLLENKKRNGKTRWKDTRKENTGKCPSVMST